MGQEPINLRLKVWCSKCRNEALWKQEIQSINQKPYEKPHWYFFISLVPVKMSRKKTEGQTPNVSNPSSNKIDDQDINHTESFT